MLADTAARPLWRFCLVMVNFMDPQTPERYGYVLGDSARFAVFNGVLEAISLQEIKT
jgi:hypothetical protein